MLGVDKRGVWAFRKPDQGAANLEGGRMRRSMGIPIDLADAFNRSQIDAFAQSKSHTD